MRWLSAYAPSNVARVAAVPDHLLSAVLSDRYITAGILWPRQHDHPVCLVQRFPLTAEFRQVGVPPTMQGRVAGKSPDNGDNQPADNCLPEVLPNSERALYSDSGLMS